MHSTRVGGSAGGQAGNKTRQRGRALMSVAESVEPAVSSAPWFSYDTCQRCVFVGRGQSQLREGKAGALSQRAGPQHGAFAEGQQPA